ncbi:hypothetical protein EL17_01220 [Anditalea andensis]|uniref:LTD domain-containing protein n=2 Tax=Anditalea andensis TaxID=1048983 RepID=A0A074LNK2_9BACT|nr:hypothetical protein EL17_01220 [Anditalea andensis]
MKKQYRLMILALTLLSLWGCSDDDSPRVELFDVNVVALYPEDFSSDQAEGVTLKLVNNATGDQQEKISGADGRATFAGLVPGTYQLTASRFLNAQEASTLTGSSSEINLNYLDNNLLLSAATGQDALSIRLSGSISGSLVIRQVYYSGSKTPENTNYFFDQFVEIYNNSSESIALDGLMISNVEGPSGQINPNTQPSPFAKDQEHVYISTAWRIPGTGSDHMLAPFTSVVIAQQGINHRSEEANPNSPVNLSNADFELFVTGSQRDIDAPNVPNMEMIYHPFNATYSLVTVFGPGTIIWRTDDFAALERAPIPDTSPTFPQVVKVPVANVIDAVEALRSATDGAFKRVPAQLDAGFTFVSNTYTGESIVRKSTTVDGNIVMKDTNNSSEDFEIKSTPAPKSF